MATLRTDSPEVDPCLPGRTFMISESHSTALTDRRHRSSLAHQNVRRDAHMVDGQEPTGTSNARLDLVGHHQTVVLLA